MNESNHGGRRGGHRKASGDGRRCGADPAVVECVTISWAGFPDPSSPDWCLQVIEWLGSLPPVRELEPPPVSASSSRVSRSRSKRTIISWWVDLDTGELVISRGGALQRPGNWKRLDVDPLSFGPR